MTDFKTYKEWTAYLMRDYYKSEFKLKPLILPTFEEWLIELKVNDRNEKINKIINGE